MLTDRKILPLILARNYDNGSVLFATPKDIIPNHIRVMGDAAYVSDPNSDIAKLLDRIAFGGKPEEVKAMLDLNPRLVFQAGVAIDPAGCVKQRVTPYELALKSGDPELGNIIADYLLEFADGQNEKKRIDDLYRPYIESMLEAKLTDYDFDPLLVRIEQSSDEDITAELDHTPEHESLLRNELEKFREHFKAVMIAMAATPGMSFNYQDLIHAFEVYKDTVDKMKNGDNYDKFDLFWRQVIGYIKRGLPAVDRQVFAQGLYYLVENGVANERSFKFTYGNVEEFRPTSFDDLHAGLGFDYSVVALGACAVSAYGGILAAGYGASLKNYVQQKQQALSNLCAVNTAQLRMGR